MYNDFYTQFMESNKNIMKPFNDLSTITTKTAESLTRQQISAANDLMGLSIKHAQNLATSKKIEDIVDLNNSYFTETSSKCMDFYNQLFETTLKASTEFTKLFEQSVKGASEEMVRKTTKAA